jgi:hypothetical protein
LHACLAGAADLAAKTNNDRPAAVKMFLRWAARNDCLPPNHRLFKADGLARQAADPRTIEFYHPKKLRALLEAAEAPLRA